MKRLFLLTISAILSMALFADPIGRERAAQYAAAYIASDNAPRLVHAARRAPVANPSLYVFSRGERQGFVIIAGDDCLPPVLGVTDSGDYDVDKLPPALLDMMAMWEEMVMSSDGKTYVPKAPYGSKDIAPLVTANWGQGSPYNRLCPFTGPGLSRCITGCVATAGAMLAYYWRDECFDRVQYDTPLYDCNRVTVNEEVQIKAGTPYHWELMQDNYGYIPDENYYYQNYPYTSESADAMATLMATLGMTSRLMYAAGETGGYTSDLSVALRTQVGLENELIRRDNYTEEEWAKLLLQNLEAGLPMEYSGSNGAGGHAFVCDGYRKSDNLFHFNFGWEGMSNGYFTTLAGDENSAGGWRYGQSILCNFAPVHPKVSVTVNHGDFTLNAENTFTVNVKNDSKVAYSGLYVLLSPDVVDAASTQTVTLYNSGVKVATGATGTIAFAFTPTVGKPHNYVVCDKNGGELARGTIHVNGDDAGTEAQHVVTSLDQIDDNSLYTLCLNTFDENRGFLSASTSSLVADEGKLTAKQRFAIIKTDRGYYIYNQSYSKFVSPISKAVSAKPKGCFSIVKAESDNRWLLVNPGNDMCLQYDSERVPSVAALSRQDAGNQWLIERNTDANADKVAAAKAAIAEYEASLPDGIAATAVNLSSPLVSVMVGESLTLTADVRPTNTTDKSIVWSTSDSGIATVEDGIVTGVSDGYAAITATCGGVQAKCQVIVTDKYDKAAVSTLDDIDERVLYSIGTDGRGFLSIGKSEMAYGARKVGETELFAVLKGSKGYYFWNVALGRFVPTAGEGTLEYPAGAYDLVPSSIQSRWIVKNHTNKVYWMQHGELGNFKVTNWNYEDEGNQWMLTPMAVADGRSVAEARERIEAYEAGKLRRIVIENGSMVMDVNSSRKLSVTLYPSSVVRPAMAWESSDESVATVSSNGTVKARAVGDATITAVGGDVVATCQLSVQEPFEEYTVKTIGQLTDGHVYTLCAGNRGFLTYDEPTMGNGVEGKQGDEQRFVILKGSKGYYLYNVWGGKFVPASGNKVLDVPNGHFTITSSNAAGKWLVTSSANGNWMQHGGSKQFLIDDKWKVQDEGNQWTISAVDRLAPSELEAAKVVIEGYEQTVGNVVTALSGIKEGTVYLLFTQRGSMLMDEHSLWGSCVIDGFRRDIEDEFQQWGIFKLDGDYYLYNLGAKSPFGFRAADDGKTLSPEPLQFVKQGRGFMLMDADGHFLNIGQAYAQGITLNDWFTPDDGNIFTICKTTATFDHADVKDELTRLTPVVAPTAIPTSEGIYDLQGRKTASPTKGLYIINGKKVMLR